MFLPHDYMPEDVRFKELEAESVKDAVCDPGLGTGRPGGVDAADLRSSASFLLPPSILNGRNQPDGAGGAAPLAAVDPLAKEAAPASKEYSMSALFAFGLCIAISS